MINYIRLLKIFIQTTEITQNEKKRSKVFYGIMGAMVVLLIMIPVGLLVGFITYALTLAVLQNNGDTQAANIVLHIIAILSAMFGFNVIVNIFYFSNDIENLLPLPIKPHELVGAKFSYSLLSENIMEFILTLGVCVGFMCARGISFFGVLTSIVSIATLPIVPLAYCGIISMLLMYFTHAVKNRDFLNKIVGVGTAVMIVGALVALVFVSDLNADTMAQSLAGGENTFLNIMNCIFPQIPLMMRSISDNSALYLLYYLLVNVAFICVFLLIASKMYIKGVSDVNTSKSKRNLSETTRIIEKSAINGIFKSYLAKEFRILFRTPPFFMDCIAINMLWPVFLVVIVILQGQTNFLSGVLTPYLAGDLKSMVYVTLVITGVSVLVTAINSLGSAAITREGKHFEFMRYIPVPLELQLNVKALASIIISGGSMLIYIIAFNIYCIVSYGVSSSIIVTAVMPVAHLILALLCVVFVSYFGIFMDSINPKLVWDDEINALRGNYNVVINTALVLIITMAVCGVMFMMNMLSVSPAIIVTADIIIMAVLAIMSYRLCMTKGVKNLMSIE